MLLALSSTTVWSGGGLPPISNVADRALRITCHCSRFRQAFTLDNYKRRLLELRPRPAPQRLQHNKGLAHAIRQAVAANVDKQLEIARALLYPEGIIKVINTRAKGIAQNLTKMPRLSAQSNLSGAGSLKQSSSSKRHSGYRRLLSSASRKAGHNFIQSLKQWHILCEFDLNDTESSNRDA